MHAASCARVSMGSKKLRLTEIHIVIYVCLDKEIQCYICMLDKYWLYILAFSAIILLQTCVDA